MGTNYYGHAPSWPPSWDHAAGYLAAPSQQRRQRQVGINMNVARPSSPAQPQALLTAVDDLFQNFIDQASICADGTYVVRRGYYYEQDYGLLLRQDNGEQVGHFFHDAGAGALYLCNYESYLPPASFVVGHSGSEKKTRSGTMRGKFGDGLKQALRKLLSHGEEHRVEIFSDGDEYQFYYRDCSFAAGVATLHFDVIQPREIMVSDYLAQQFPRLPGHAAANKHSFMLRSTLVRVTIPRDYFKMDRYLPLWPREESRFFAPAVRLRNHHGEAAQTSVEVLISPEILKRRIYVKGMLVVDDSNASWYRSPHARPPILFGYNALHHDMVYRDRFDSIPVFEQKKLIAEAWEAACRRPHQHQQGHLHRDTSIENAKQLLRALSESPNSLEMQAIKESPAAPDIGKRLLEAFTTEHGREASRTGDGRGMIAVPYHPCRNAHEMRLICALGRRAVWVPADLFDILVKNMQRTIEEDYDAARLQDLCRADLVSSHTGDGEDTEEDRERAVVFQRVFSAVGIGLRGVIDAGRIRFVARGASGSSGVRGSTDSGEPPNNNTSIACLDKKPVESFTLQGFEGQHKCLNGTYTLNRKQGQVNRQFTFWKDCHFLYYDGRKYAIQEGRRFGDVCKFTETHPLASLATASDGDDWWAPSSSWSVRKGVAGGEGLHDETEVRVTCSASSGSADENQSSNGAAPTAELHVDWGAFLQEWAANDSEPLVLLAMDFVKKVIRAVAEDARKLRLQSFSAGNWQTRERKAARELLRLFPNHVRDDARPECTPPENIAVAVADKSCLVSSDTDDAARHENENPAGARSTSEKAVWRPLEQLQRSTSRTGARRAAPITSDGLRNELVQVVSALPCSSRRGGTGASHQAPMASNASSPTEVPVHHLGRAGEDRSAQPADAVHPVPETSRGPRPCVAVLQDFVSTCASQYFPQAGDGVPHDHDCGPSREEFESSLKVEIERSLRRTQVAFGLPRGGASASSSRDHAGPSSVDQEQRLRALLGDAMLDAFLYLKCARERPGSAKLTAKEADTLRRELLCTKTLGGSSDTPEAGRAAAEELEAEVGKKAEFCAEELCNFLERCVMDHVEMPLARVEPALRPDDAGGSIDEKQKTRVITRVITEAVEAIGSKKRPRRSSGEGGNDDEQDDDNVEPPLKKQRVATKNATLID